MLISITHLRQRPTFQIPLYNFINTSETFLKPGYFPPIVFVCFKVSFLRILLAKRLHVNLRFHFHINLFKMSHLLILSIMNVNKFFKRFRLFFFYFNVKPFMLRFIAMLFELMSPMQFNW